jgi:lipid-A-disaccharide synthase
MKLFISAGEPSGDVLGASFLKQLKIDYPSLEIYGIGGPAMENEGLHSLFPFHELSLMGIFEIIPHLWTIFKHIRQTANFIIDCQPDIILTIDSPGFHKRLLKKIKYLAIPAVHCVAPTVWAWRPKRAQHMAQWVDHLLTLFRFEPPYFEKVGIETTWVGHPMIENVFNINVHERDSKKLLILPGSRKREIETHLPIFLKSVADFQNHNSGWTIIIPTLPHLKELVSRILISHYKDDIQVVVLNDLKERLELFSTCSLAIATSGTVSLELGLCNVPHVVAYRISAITYWIVKNMITIPYASLVNILCGKRVLPECIQNECTSFNIHQALESLNETRDTIDFNLLKDQILRSPHEMPSQAVSNVIRKIASKKPIN